MLIYVLYNCVAKGARARARARARTSLPEETAQPTVLTSIDLYKYNQALNQHNTSVDRCY